MTIEGKLPTEESPMDAVVEAIHRVMDEEDLPAQHGIVMARRYPPRRIAVLSYALAFALNEESPWRPELRDFQERLLGMAREPEYGPGVEVVEGKLGAAGHAFYCALTLDDDAQQPLTDALAGVAAQLRLVEAELRQLRSE